jgi:hypothetical protein
MIISVMGPMGGTQNDVTVLQQSGLLEKLDNIAYPADDGVNGHFYNVFGDKGYAIRSFRVIMPIEGNNISESSKSFNLEMSKIRVSVEHAFSKESNWWKYVEYFKNNKLLHTPVIPQYFVATLLTNCHSCLYSNQTSVYFNHPTPTLQYYLQ